MKPKLLKLVRDESFIQFIHEVDRATETVSVNDPASPRGAKDAPKTVLQSNVEKVDITSHEAPLPAFDKALQALADVIANVMETGQSWKKGIVVRSFALTYTKTGIRSVVISFNKRIDATDSFHPMKTPAFQIDDGKTADEGRKQCSKPHADAVIKMIKEAERYAAGERSQQMLKFNDGDEGGDDDDKDNSNELPFEGGDGATAGKKADKKKPNAD